MSIVIAIIVFSMVIFIHELGHFLLAKKNGIVVEEFSIGMGPRIASCKKGGTRYSLKLFPIGGSCMMLGEDAEDVQDGSFNHCNVWGRISTIFAGPAFNFILAFVLACIVLCMDGYHVPVVTKLDEQETAYAAGLRDGDIIKKYNGSKIRFYGELGLELYVNPITAAPIHLTVERAGKEYNVTLEPTKVSKYRMGFDYSDDDSEFVVDGITKGAPMYDAGVRNGDQILSVNGTAVTTGKEFRDYITEHPLDGSALQIEYKHDGKTNSTLVTPKVYNSYDTGLTYTGKRMHARGFNVFTYGIAEVDYYVKSTFKSIALLIKGKLGMDQLGGPVAVVSSIGSSVKTSKVQGLAAVIISILNWGILLSANLGVMNLLPLPALDGGRLVFLIIEAICRKPLNRKVEGIVHTVGFMLLMLLMVFVFYNDIMRLI